MKPAVLVFFAAASAIPVASSAKLSFVPVFEAGVGGYNCYRIPALSRLPNGTLLAFAEGRRFSCGDHGWNDIVQRSSHDGGQTWNALSVVYGESSAAANVTIGNPAPIVLASQPGSILVPFCRNNLEVGVMRSDDGGSSYHLSANISIPNWSWVATGPPGGLELGPSSAAPGRLVIPMNQINGPRDPNVASAFLSDDGGKTWRLASSLVPGGNECQAAELPWTSPPTLHLSMRGARAPMRLGAESTDGGKTWSAPWETIPEDECEGSVVSLPRSRRIAMSSAFSSKRVNMTLHTSADNGRTFTAAAHVWTGPSAYSSLVDLGSGGAADNVGLLFEKGDASPYESIAFVQVGLPQA